MPAVLISAWISLVLVAYLGPIRFPMDRVLSVFTTQGLEVTWAGVVGAWQGHNGRMAAAIATAAAAWGVGRRACAVLRIRSSGWLAAFPIGLILLGVCGLGMGLTGLARPAPLGVVLISAIVAGITATPRFRPNWAWPTGPGRLAWIMVAAIVLVNLPMALAPEVTYDALAVHLGAPAEFLKIGRVVRLDHLMYSDLPFDLQMNYLFAMAVGDDGAAKLLHFLLGVAAMVAVGRLASRLLPTGETAGAWAVCFLAATPTVATLMGRANVDLGVLYLVTAGAYWVVRSRGAAGTLFAGLLLGGATSVKLTGGYGVIAGVAVCLVRRQGLRPAVMLLTGAAAAYAPWLIKAWLMTGNPVYPMASFLLGGCGWSARNAAIFQKDVQGPTAANLVYPDALSRLASPWLLVMKDRKTDGALSPFALMLLPLLAVSARLRAQPAVRRLSAFAGVFWLGWFLTSRDPRFFVPAWPIVCALAAAALVELTGRVGRLARGACVALIALTPLFEAAMCWYSFSPGPVLWGAIERRQYAKKIIAPDDRYVPMAIEAGNLCPPGQRVLMVGEVKGAWVTPRVLYPTMPDTPHLEEWVRESPSMERLIVRFKQARIGLVFFDPGAVEYWRNQFGHYVLTPRESALLSELMGRLKPVRWIGQPHPLLLYRPSWLTAL